MNKNGYICVYVYRMLPIHVDDVTMLPSHLTFYIYFFGLQWSELKINFTVI